MSRLPVVGDDSGAWGTVLNDFLGVAHNADGSIKTGAPTDANLATSDITTNNVSTSKHGFAPKLPNDPTKFLNGVGGYAVPAGAGGTTNLIFASDFAGGDAGAKIQAAINSVAQSNGVRVHIVADFQGAQTISTPLKIRQGAVVYMTGSYSLAMTSKAISSIVRSGGADYTVTTSSAHGLTAEDPVTIAGVTDPSFSDDGVASGMTVQVATVVSATVFTCVGNVGGLPNASSSGGTVGRPGIWLQNEAELHGIGGTAGSPIGVGGVTITAGTNFNSACILAMSNNGVNQWWHGGQVQNIRLEGNRANQSVYGTGLEIVKFGDASIISNILSTDMKTDCFRYMGGMSTNGRSEQLYATVSDGWGINALLASGQMHIMDAHITDNALGGIQFYTGNGGMTATFVNLVYEAGDDPCIRFARGTVQLTIIGMSAQASLGNNPGKTLFLYEAVTGGSGSEPDITVSQLVTDGDYQYMYRDTEKNITVTTAQVLDNGLRTPFWQKSLIGAVYSSAIAITPFNKTLTNGANGVILLGDGSAGLMRLVGPTGAFSIGSMYTAFGPRDGHEVALFNSTSQQMTIINNDTNEASASYRFQTNTGANVVLSGPCVVTFFWSLSTLRWILKSSLPAAVAGAVTGVTATAPIVSSGGTAPVISLDNDKGCRVYHNADQNIINATEVAVAFNSERFDTDTMHDTVTNNSRITIKTAGKYLVGTNVKYDANATGMRSLSFLLNGITPIAGTIVNAVTVAATGTFMNISTIYDFALNDYIEVIVYQDSTSTLAVKSTGNYTPEFYAQKF